ncbi:MAG: imidazoleglycerol-phosphate dehydratase HisB [Promethearchaeia archaeon]
MERIAKNERITKETSVEIQLNLDGSEDSQISTTVKFFDHMLTLLARHADIMLNIEAEGDLTHHIVEDVAITLGECFLDALGDKKGINRYGSAFIPMDESLARCVIDFSGRKALNLELNLNECNIEDMALEDVEHFFNSFAENAKMNLHLKVLYGEDQHHKVEAAFKALAHSIKNAIEIVSDKIPSTKGSL